MNSTIRELENERQSVYKVYSKNNRISILLYVLGITIAVIGVVLGDIFAIFGILLAITSFIIGIIFGAKVTKVTKPFRLKFKTTLIKALLDDLYDDVIYKPEQSIPLDVILSTGLVKRPDRHKSEDLIRCVYEGVKIQSSDFVLEERHTYYDSKGRRHTSYQTYFSGRWIIFRFERKFKNALRILEKNWLGFAVTPKGFKKIETESIAFNKKFLLESTDQQHALYIVTPSMIEKLQEFEKTMGGTVSMLFQGNELHIALNFNHDSLEPKLKYPLTDEVLKSYRFETDFMAAIINEFGLSKDKFMSNQQ